MPDAPISGLPAAGALAGADLAVIVQGGVTVQTTVGAFASFSAAFTLATAIPSLGAAGAIAAADDFLVYQAGAPLLTTAQDVADFAADVTLNTTIPGLGAAAALTGAEPLLVYQAGVPVLTTAQDVANLASGGGASLFPGYVSGLTYTRRGALVTNRNSLLNTVQWVPLVIEAATTIDQLAIRTGTANAVAGNVDLGIYDLSGVAVGNLLATTGPIAVAGTPNVNYTGAIAPLALAVGVYWTCTLADAAIQFQGLSASDPYLNNMMGGGSMQTAAGGGNPNVGYTIARVFALGCPATGAGAAIANGGGVPLPGFRVQ